jgi:hydrogenase nickel incorporation protein HypA/HybF
MHELSIATSILDRALTAASDHGAEEIEELTVEVGTVTHVNPGQLKFVLEAAMETTIAADAEVILETVTPDAQCDCGWSGEPETLDVAVSYAPDISCPSCGARLTLDRGRECRLASIEIPDTASGPTGEDAPETA